MSQTEIGHNRWTMWIGGWEIKSNDGKISEISITNFTDQFNIKVSDQNLLGLCSFQASRKKPVLKV